MSWTAGLWPVASYARVQHIIDLHAAIDERYKAKHNGTAWPDKVTAPGPYFRNEYLADAMDAVKDLCAPAAGEAWFRDSDIAGFATTTYSAAALMNTPINFRSAEVMNYLYNLLNDSMVIEMVNYLSSRLSYNGWNYNLAQGFGVSTVSWAAAKTAAESAFNSTGRSNQSGFSTVTLYSQGYKLTSPDEWYSEWTHANREYQCDDIWTGANSEMLICIVPEAKTVYDAHGVTGLTEDTLSVITRGTAGTSATRTERALDETNPSGLTWVAEPGDDETLERGFTTDAFRVGIDWGVTGGFSYV